MSLPYYSFYISKRLFMLTKFHPYHIVTLRPWPLTCSLAAFFLALILNNQMFYSFSFFIILLKILTIIITFSWWKDISREVDLQGLHSNDVLKGLKLGIILFITSEVIFFLSFFWSFFHFSLRPNIELGQTWPPISIIRFNPINVPLLNTIILISSGASITWAHHSLLKNNFNNTRIGLSITWILGIYFTIIQYIEYFQSEFNIRDSRYGRIFFLATGFHGIHVIVGSIYLLYSDINLKIFSSTRNHFLIIELAAWYWHFVDVIWLFLYLCIYWWGK